PTRFTLFPYTTLFRSWQNAEFPVFAYRFCYEAAGRHMVLRIPEVKCDRYRIRKRRAKASTPRATPSNITVTPPSGTPAPTVPKSVLPARQWPLARKGIVTIPLRLPTYQTSDP